MIEHMPQVGECQQIPRFRHGFPRRPRDLTADSGSSIVMSKITEPSPECRKNGVDPETRTQRDVAPCEAE
jgi:hypothetical protein